MDGRAADDPFRTVIPKRAARYNILSKNKINNIEGKPMTLDEYAKLAEIVGVIVVVATLIYLAIQVRQGATLLRSEARQSQVALDLDLTYRWMEWPEIQESIGNPDKPPLESKVRIYYWLVAFFRVREYLWFQYRDGTLDEYAWHSYRNVIPFILSAQRARRYWAEFSPNFDPQFVEMVDQLVAEPSIWGDEYWINFAATD